MHDQIEITRVVPIHLDEMIAAAQGADAEPPPFRIHLRQAAQFVDGGTPRQPMRRSANTIAAGNMGPDDMVQQNKIQIRPLQRMHQHAAADVHADKIGDYLVGDRHSGADGATGAGMRIRHDADAAAAYEFLVAQSLNLLFGHFFQLVGENHRFINLAANRFHIDPFSFFGFAEIRSDEPVPASAGQAK